MKLAIIAALSRELKYLRKLSSPHQIVIAQSGMGMRVAERRLLSLIRKDMPDFVLSIGFAGALFKNALPGDLVWGQTTTLFPEKNGFNEKNSIMLGKPDELLEKISTRIAIRAGHIITIPERRSKEEIISSSPWDPSCPVCDMETYALARICRKRNIKFISIRAITDTLEEDITSPFFNLHDEHGNLKIARLLSLLIKKPASIKEMLKLAKNSDLAAKKLSRAVRVFLELI